MAPLLESNAAVLHFAEQELAAEIARACPKPVVTLEPPRISSLGIHLRLHLRSADPVGSAALSIELFSDDGILRSGMHLSDPVSVLTTDDRQGMAAVVRQFLSRCGAAVPPGTDGLEEPSPATGCA
jgi:hypothetical protein